MVTRSTRISLFWYCSSARGISKQPNADHPDSPTGPERSQHLRTLLCGLLASPYKRRSRRHGIANAASQISRAHHPLPFQFRSRSLTAPASSRIWCSLARSLPIVLTLPHSQLTLHTHADADADAHAHTDADAHASALPHSPPNNPLHLVSRSWVRRHSIIPTRGSTRSRSACCLSVHSRLGLLRRSR